MKSDGIDRYKSNDGHNGHALWDGGRWCEFKDVEKLVDSITRQRDSNYNEVERLKEEAQLVENHNHADAQLLALDIKRVLDSISWIPSRHVDRLLAWVKRVGQ